LLLTNLIGRKMSEEEKTNRGSNSVHLIENQSVQKR